MIPDENFGEGLVNPYPGQAVGRVDFRRTDEDYAETGHVDTGAHPHFWNAVTSLIRKPPTGASLPFWETPARTHKFLIDLDMPAKVVPSSTPGHCHLFIDHAMTWDTYEKLLIALADAGLVEPGYVNASIDQGYTTVRLPHVRKD